MKFCGQIISRLLYDSKCKKYNLQLDVVLMILRGFKTYKSSGSKWYKHRTYIMEALWFFLLKNLKLLNMCWCHGFPGLKQGNRSKCSSYRGESVCNSCYKICTKLKPNRQISTNVLVEAQSGFRKGRPYICRDVGRCTFTCWKLLTLLV
jgi:hypothetical protein